MSDDEYFETGYHVDRYYELEEDLVKFLKFISLEVYDTPEKRTEVRSLYLADLLLRTGSNIDVFFRKLIFSKYPEIEEERKKKESEKDCGRYKYRFLSFDDYKKLDEKFVCRTKHLSDSNVYVFQNNNFITPFDNWTKNTPRWWTSYNHVKHQADLEKANLDNVLQALSALFLLICFKKHSSKLIHYNYLCINPGHKGEILSRRLKESHHPIVTKLFISPIES